MVSFFSVKNSAVRVTYSRLFTSLVGTPLLAIRSNLLASSLSGTFTVLVNPLAFLLLTSLIFSSRLSTSLFNLAISLCCFFTSSVRLAISPSKISTLSVLVFNLPFNFSLVSLTCANLFFSVSSCFVTSACLS